MAISDKINSIKTHIGEAYTAIQGKEGTIPANKNCENLKNAIESIPTSGKTQEKTVNITENGVVITTPDTGYDGMSSVTTVTNVQPDLQEKEVTPTESQQIATPDAGYDGLSKVTVSAIQTKETSVTPAQGQQVLEVTDNKYYKKVTVEAIPADYVIPSGTIQITENGVVDVSGKANANVNVPSKEEEAKEVDLAMASGNQTITPTSGKVLSQVVVKKPATMLPENIKKDVNIGGVTGTLEIGGGGELNVAYGDTAPEDTSKLWVKTAEPDSVEISPDFGYGEAVQTTGIKSGFPTSNITCEDGDYLYINGSSKIEKYNKKTLEKVETTNIPGVDLMQVSNGILYCTRSVYIDGNNQYQYRATLYAIDLTTNTETELKSGLEHLGGNLIIYNNKIYLIGGGYEYIYRSGGWNYTYPVSNKITIYDISTKIVENISYPYGHWYSRCCLIGNNVFVFGGRTRVNGGEGDSYNQIIKIDLDTKTVTKCNAVLPIATSKMGVSNLGNYIYISGGDKTSQIVYRYDTVNDTIEQVNVTLEHTRTACATFFNGTELYLLGSNAIVDKLQIDVPLSSTKLKIISDWLNNQFAVINGSSKVMIGVNKAFKGDENNKAKEVTAYVHDGTNWHTLDGEITLTKLYAPKISISGKTLTITNDGRNGSKVTNYKVYNGSTLLTTITATTLDLTTVITANGTYNISVIATGTGYTDSDSSNVVEYNYASYNITTNLTGVTANASNPTTVSTLASSTLTFTANTGYNLPDNVTVTGAEFTWTKSSGTLVLSNPTGAVSITVAGVAISRTITATLTNVTAASENATTIATGETKVLTYTAASGYTLPDSVTVTGATGVWNKDAGTLTLSNPTANVTFTIAGVEAATGYNVTVTADGSSSDFTVYDGQSSSGNLLGTFTSGQTADVICSSGYLYFYSSDYNGVRSTTGGVTKISNTLCSVSGDGTVNVNFYCLIEGTQITLADGTTKAIEDITYDDELLVWNFYAGRFDKAKPIWIKVAEVAPRYNLVKFSNGSEVGFVGAGGEKGYHRIFNKEAGKFTYTGNLKETPNGTTTFAQDGTFPTVVSQEIVEKEVKFYNVITDKHYNLFANGILTSCKLSNKYRIEDMKYVGEKLISEEEEKSIWEEKNKLRK